MTKYVSIDHCKEIIFPIIQRHMATGEPAPQYMIERSGLEKVDSILHLMQGDDYYPSLSSKASYMFCAVIGGHPFSNGNKRLAVALLANFLLLNGCGLRDESIGELRRELQLLFPHLQWQQVKSFRYAYEYFLYHLPLIVADRHQKGRMTFHEECSAVERALDVIVHY